MTFNIAIDGPAGAGKSTIAKRTAKELSYIYVDTGAMYRAIGLFMLRKETNLADLEEVQEALNAIEVTIAYQNGEQQVLLNGENVSGLIREEKVGAMASKVSAIPDVRTKLLNLQRELALKNNVVMDGRDIGTVILPDAQLKIYLTASAETRARRRYHELLEKGAACDYETILTDIMKRDDQDMHRDVSPLRQAEDAVYLDSSEMSIEEVAEKIIKLAQSRQ